MEIRISTENLIRALWMACVALSAIGFLLMLYGLASAFTVSANARIQEAMTPVAMIAAAAAMSVIPWCLASSVSKMLGGMDGVEVPSAAEDSQSEDG